jgi:uncharacterized tellurite resistance protein B-like protein
MSSLTPQLQQHCQQCDPEERKDIVAYCCYMAAADKRLQKSEVATVQEIAGQLNVDQAEVSRLARRVREGRQRVRVPRSDTGRKLMIELAVQLAAADAHLDARERVAIDRLATHLKIPPEQVQTALDAAMQTKQPRAIPPVPSPPQSPATEPRSATVAEALSPSNQVPSNQLPSPQTPEPQGFFARLFDSLTANIQVVDLEAKLYPQPFQPGMRKLGELEYTLTRGGNAELEIELKDLTRYLELPAGESLTVVVDGNLISEIHIYAGGSEQTLHGDTNSNPPFPTFSAGQTAEILHLGKTILAGEFKND